MPVPEAPGRYVGDETIILGPHPPQPYRRADGSRLGARIIKTLMGDAIPRFYLAPGEDLLWKDYEVYGETYYMPRGTEVQRWLGLGKRVLPDHEGLDDNTLIDMGYRFLLPRSDVEPLFPLAEFLSQQQELLAAQAPAPTPSQGQASVPPVPAPVSQAQPATAQAKETPPPAAPAEAAPLPPSAAPAEKSAAAGETPSA